MGWIQLASVILVAVSLGCGGGSGAPATGPAPTPPAPANLVFSASPIDPAAIRWITPLGNLNPPAHPLPTDHIYFYFANPDAGESPTARRTAFYAPADGTISMVMAPNPGTPDVKVFVRATSSHTYYLDHLIPDAPLQAGAQVRAGQRLGTTGSVYAIDLGLINDTLTQPFLNPSRYTNSDSLHADAPLKYFAEPLRSQLYQSVQRLGAERDGRIVYDLAGRLEGNWFVEFGTTPLAFARDTYDPTQVRISVPGIFPTVGVFAIRASDPDPREVSVASGRILYQLTPSRTGLPFSAAPSAWMLVQLVDDQHLKIEVVPIGQSAGTFSSNARIFVR